MRRILGPILGLALLSALTAVPATAKAFPDQIDLPAGLAARRHHEQRDDPVRRLAR